MASSCPTNTTTRISLGSSELTEKEFEPEAPADCPKDHTSHNVISRFSIVSGGPKAVGEPMQYPEGGRRAWGVVLGAFLVQFSAYGYISAFGVYQDYYTRVYMTEHSASAISWIGSTSAFILLATGLFSGRLYDKGCCMGLLYCGTFLTSLCLFMLSLVQKNHYLETLLCQGVGLGLGTGLLYVPSSAIVSQYFNKRRALVMPMVSSGVPLGSVVTPILINSLLQKPNLTFAIVIRINAALVTAILILACWLIRPRLNPPKRQADLVNCVRRFVKDGPYVSMTAGFFAFGMSMLFPVFFLQLAAINYGLGKTFAFYSLVILNGSAFFGRMSCGLLSQMAGVDFLAIVSAIMCGGIMFAFVGVGSVVSVVLVAVIYGFFFGLLVATMAPLTASLTDNMEELGNSLRLGISFTFLGLGQLIGPPIMGALLEGYRWWRPAVLSGILFMVAATCFLVIRLILRGKKATPNGLDA